MNATDAPATSARSSTVSAVVWDGDPTSFLRAANVDVSVDPGTRELILPAEGGDLRAPLGAVVEITVTVRGGAV